MDFDNILNIASQNQGLNNVKHKRYSLQTGPPKKFDRVKGVNSAAVQAYLKKKSLEERKKEMHLKKKKEELLAKRVELKSDRKARAMASRTKDNFRGYNGVPVVEEPKKRRSKAERDEDARTGGSYNHGNDDYDDEDNYEYEQTDSEPELEPQRPVAKGRAGVGGAGGGVKTPGKAAAAPSSRPPAALNFADLLKLAEKKQHEPVELKVRPARPEERLRTAEELRELEMERWAKRPDKGRDPRPDRDRERDRDRESRPQSGPGISKKPPSLQKEQRGGRPGASGGSERKKPPTPAPAAVGAVRAQGSTRPPAGERERAKPPHGDRDRPRVSAGTSGAASGGKAPSRGTTTSSSSSSSQGSARQAGPRPPSGPRPSTASTLSSRKAIPASAHGRPGQGGSLRGGASASCVDAGKPRRPCDPPRSGSNPAGPGRGGPPRPASRGSPLPNPRPGSQPNIPQGRPINGARPPGGGAGRPGNAGPMPERRPAGNIGSGPGRPKCTVVAETISSKDMVGAPRPGMPARPQGMQQRPGMPARPHGMQQRPGMPSKPQGMQQRPGMPARPPVPNLPPITSAYKNQYEEEEEYDSEMEDFIDDGGEDQDEISKHIKEIFGYDRKKYKEESEYALRFMESSWKDLQKEEARSLRLAVQEDLEEEKREEDEFKKKSSKRQKVK